MTKTPKSEPKKSERDERDRERKQERERVQPDPAAEDSIPPESLNKPDPDHSLGIEPEKKPIPTLPKPTGDPIEDGRAYEEASAAFTQATGRDIREENPPDEPRSGNMPSDETFTEQGDLPERLAERELKWHDGSVIQEDNGPPDPRHTALPMDDPNPPNTGGVTHPEENVPIVNPASRSTDKVDEEVDDGTETAEPKFRRKDK